MATMVNEELLKYHFEYGVDFVYVKDLWFKPPVE